MIVHPGNGAVTGYNLTRSLRVRASASAYLSRTPASAGDRQKFTQRYLLKRGALGTARLAVSTNDGLNVNWDQIYFNSSDQLEVWGYSGTSQYRLITNKVYRDPAGFYDIQVAFDTTQATASNRIRLYDNGVEITSFASATYPPLNYSTYFNLNCPHTIGYSASSFDGYLCETQWVVGQQLTPSSFGSTNSTTGVWQPAAYTGTYGTNGFYLPFTDNSALTTSSNVGLGKDFSGNGNYWTTNNISLTAGVTYDSMTDVPTLTSASASNFAVLNPLVTNATLTEGNLATWSPISQCGACATISLPFAKTYYEVVPNSNPGGLHYGVIRENPTVAQLSTTANSDSVIYRGDGAIFRNTGSGFTQVQTVASYTNGDVLSCAIDMVGLSIQFYKSNSAVGTPVSLTSGISYTPWLTFGGPSVGSTINFGQRPWAFTPPSGFVALNTFNIPDGSITTSGSFVGNVSAEGPSIYLNGVPTAMTINGNAVTFGTHADKTAYGLKVRSSSTSYNSTGTNTYSVSTTGAKFKYANAQGNP